MESQGLTNFPLKESNINITKYIKLLKYKYKISKVNGCGCFAQWYSADEVEASSDTAGSVFI